MKETSKCVSIMKEKKYFDKYLNGIGIDIGCGDDKLEVPNGSVDAWDKENGDATYLKGIENQKYDFVYSSHCLEHLNDTETAVHNWARVLKTEGFLYIVVPEFVLYEKMRFPSVFNGDHKVTFSCYITRDQVKRQNHFHENDFVFLLKNLNLKIIEFGLQDKNFNYNLGSEIDQTKLDALAQLFFIAKKM